jgi:hypothetical protein
MRYIARLEPGLIILIHSHLARSVQYYKRPYPHSHPHSFTLTTPHAHTLNMFPRFTTSLVVALFGLISLTSALPLGHRSEPLRWRTPFGKHLVADSLVELEWKGGSGNGYVSLLPDPA